MFGAASRGIPSFGDKSWKMPVDETTVAALPANTYTATSGVNPAYLTANANGALTVDGTAVSVGDRILVRNEASNWYNGIYLCTNAGSVSTKWVLQRASDAWLAQQLPNGSTVFTNNGLANSQTFFVLSGTIGNIDTDTENWIVQNANANLSPRSWTTTGASTYNVPTDPSFFGVLVECIGSGGGGGGAQAAAAGANAKGGGGGSGGYARVFLGLSILTLGGTATVTVGAGGSGGVGAANGGNGNVSKFTVGGVDYCKANGGGGGGHAASSSATFFGCIGGPGGSSTGEIGDFYFDGAPGGPGVGGGSLGVSGQGGSGPFGGGGVSVSSGVAGAALNGISGAINTGSGGSGALSTSTGAAATGGFGGDGIVMLYEYYSS